MDDEVYVARRLDQPIAVADVADEVAHLGTVELLSHLVLLELIAREDDQLARAKAVEQRGIRIEPELPVRFYQSGRFSLKSIACGHFRPQTISSGPPDIVITASGSGFGVFMVVAPQGYAGDSDVPWAAVPVTDYSWIMKYDNILSIDMDSDGDMYLVTTEENEGLLLQGAGVLWYENKSCQ